MHTLESLVKVNHNIIAYYYGKPFAGTTDEYLIACKNNLIYHCCSCDSNPRNECPYSKKERVSKHKETSVENYQDAGNYMSGLTVGLMLGAGTCYGSDI